MFKDCREFASSYVTLNAKSQTHHWEDKHIPPFKQMCIILIQLSTSKNKLIFSLPLSFYDPYYLLMEWYFFPYHKGLIPAALEWIS